MKIIIIEDNKITLKFLTSIFSMLTGMKVVGAYESGEELFAHPPVEEPDIAITDLNLPGISGIELIDRMRKNWPGIKVICLTMNGDKKTLLSALDAGASGYIVKGASSREIIQAVEKVMQGGRAMDKKTGYANIPCLGYCKGYACSWYKL